MVKPGDLCLVTGGCAGCGLYHRQGLWQMFANDVEDTILNPLYHARQAKGPLCRPLMFSGPGPACRMLHGNGLQLHQGSTTSRCHVAELVR